MVLVLQKFLSDKTINNYLLDFKQKKRKFTNSIFLIQILIGEFAVK
jgi:hypothetical protein